MKYLAMVILVAILAAAPEKEQPPTWRGIQALFGPAFATSHGEGWRVGRPGIEAKRSGIFPRFFCIPSPCYPPPKQDPK